MERTGRRSHAISAFIYSGPPFTTTLALLMKRLFVAATFLLYVWGPARSQEPAEVGYCAGPPCCRYEGSRCSERDNRALIAMSRIVSGSKTFCSSLMNAHWSYLPLELDHTVTSQRANEYFSVRGASTEIAAKAGHFDINNDGNPEYLAWLSAYSGAGQGCDVEIYAELNKDRTDFERSTLSTLLGQHSCRDYHRAFRFENKTYIENRRIIEQESLDFMFPSVLTEVHLLEGQNRHTVCKFALNLPR